MQIVLWTIEIYFYKYLQQHSFANTKKSNTENAPKIGVPATLMSYFSSR